MSSLTSQKFKRTHRRNGDRRGFTLLEVLIAISVLGVIMTFAYQITSQTISSKKRIEKLREVSHAARTGMEKMVQDISMAYLLGSESHTGRRQGSPLIKTGFKGDDRALNFNTLAHRRLFDGARESEAAEVGYKLEKDNDRRDLYILMRRESAAVDNRVDEGGKWYPVASFVKKWELKFYNAKQQDWVSSWNTESDPDSKLPRAVKITLTFQNPLKPEDRERELVFSTIAMVGLYANPIDF